MSVCVEGGRVARAVERVHNHRVDGRPKLKTRAAWRRSWSWGIALFEYALQVPANRIGYANATPPTS